MSDMTSEEMPQFSSSLQDDMQIFHLPTFEEEYEEFRKECPHEGWYVVLSDSLEIMELSKCIYGAARNVRKRGIIPGSSMFGEYDADSTKVVVKGISFNGIKVPYLSFECTELDRFLPNNFNSMYGVFRCIDLLKDEITHMKSSKEAKLMDEVDKLRSNYSKTFERLSCYDTITDNNIHGSRKETTNG